MSAGTVRAGDEAGYGGWYDTVPTAEPGPGAGPRGGRGAA